MRRTARLGSRPNRWSTPRRSRPAQSLRGSSTRPSRAALDDHGRGRRAGCCPSPSATGRAGCRISPRFPPATSSRALRLRGVRLPLRLHRRRLFCPPAGTTPRAPRSRTRSRPSGQASTSCPGFAELVGQRRRGGPRPRHRRERPGQAGHGLPAVRRGELRPPARPKASAHVQRLPATWGRQRTLPRGRRTRVRGCARSRRPSLARPLLPAVRHSLVHRDGIVDDQYIAKSGDDSYRLGQRLVISPAAVRDAADLIERLANGLAWSCSGSPRLAPPDPGTSRSSTSSAAEVRRNPGGREDVPQPERVLRRDRPPRGRRPRQRALGADVPHHVSAARGQAVQEVPGHHLQGRPAAPAQPARESARRSGHHRARGRADAPGCEWPAKRMALLPPVARSLEEIHEAQRRHGTSIGMFRPKQITGLVKRRAKPWTERKQAALRQQRLGLGDAELAELADLEQIPWSFAYKFTCDDERRPRARARHPRLGGRSVVPGVSRNVWGRLGS